MLLIAAAAADGGGSILRLYRASRGTAWPEFLICLNGRRI